MILLIDNYDSFTFNVFQMIGQLGHDCQVIRNDEISCDLVRKLKPSHLVFSPGPGRPEDAGLMMDLIHEFKDQIPILGICLGHQALVLAFGGQVTHAPSPQHGKTSRVHHGKKGYFADLPSSFTVARYHSLIADSDTLPECLEVAAQTEDGLIMAVQHRRLPILGLQFHPESVATENGVELVGSFLAQTQGRSGKEAS